MNTKPKFSERALYLFSPKRGNDAYNRRLQAEREKEQATAGGQQRRQSAPKMSYEYHGASQVLNSLVGWIVGAGNAEDNIDLFGSTLRERARDLYTGGGLAKSGVQTLAISVTGWGIQPKPKIDGELLGMTDEEREEAEKTILREWRLWADNTMCDAERQKNFYSLQQLAYLSSLMSGDVFALFGMKENKRTPYQTTIRLLEADRICTPDSSGSESQETESGGRIIDGVEIDKEGAVIRYHIASRNPNAGNDGSELTWQPIDAYGKDTGYPNILHILVFERPEQRRGIPFVSAEIELQKQFSRYMNAELAGKVVSAMLTLFITSKEDDGKAGMEDAVNEDEKVTDDEMKLELAPGAIYDLPPGKDVVTVDPKRSDTQFESFVSTCITVIAASMGIPKEVLIKKYDSNYTAARAALLDFWKMVRVCRTRFNTTFNQPIYEQWLSEAVATGRIDAPGFFDDPAIRQAWCGCNWMGATLGHVDPKKEVEAAEMRIRNNITTEEQEASEYNGNDWTANVQQRRKEIAVRSEMYGTTQDEKQDGDEKKTSPDDEDEEGEE